MPDPTETLAHRTVVYGGSDDLVEVDGTEIREEWTAPAAKTFYVVLSTGHALQMTLGEVWALSLVAGDSNTCTIVPARDLEDTGMGNDEDGCPGYSEKAVVVGEVRWAVVTDRLQKRNVS